MKHLVDISLLLWPFCGPNIEPARWISRRLASKSALLWDVHTAAAFWGVAPASMIDMAVRGETPSVCTPDGAWG